MIVIAVRREVLECVKLEVSLAFCYSSPYVARASLPALILGSTLGILAFRYVDDAIFRRIVRIVLMASGLMLVA